MTRTLNRPAGQVPAFIRWSKPLTGAAIRVGVPMGPNTLMTVRGRTSGEPRTFPVAVAPIDGHRYVIAVYGDVNWSRNLRAAGEADIRVGGGRTEHVIAHELDQAEATTFFAETLPGFIRRLPWFGRLFGAALFRFVAPEIGSDPARAALGRPVFELRTG
jgi:deazaflavin-dependent oxidoreductase (nitroreductase family)